MVPVAPPIQIIPTIPQDSQELAQQPTLVGPPLPPLFTPTSVPEPKAATMASAVTAATPASAVTAATLTSAVSGIASPRPSPPRTQLRRSPRLLSPGPLVIPSTTPPPQPRLSPSPRRSPSPAQLRRSPCGLTPGPAGLHSRSTMVLHPPSKSEEKSGNF
jgi:hypothetical protein